MRESGVVVGDHTGRPFAEFVLAALNCATVPENTVVAEVKPSQSCGATSPGSRRHSH